MEKDNKILLGAILIILVAMVSFSFRGITGKAVSEKTIVAVSPGSITAGESITIYVKPGSVGVEQMAYFYREDGLRIPGTVSLCRSSKCADEIKIDYKLVDSWDGNADWPYGEASRGYYLRVNDYRSEEYKTASFTVKRAYELPGPQVHR